MPTEKVDKILDDAQRINFKGWITFHHFSEPFLDPRLIEFATKAKSMGMTPFEHTNGDFIRKDDELCQQALEVFNHIVIGLYDHKTPEEQEEDKAFWRERLGGKARFSSVDNVYVRSHYTEKNIDGYEQVRGDRPEIKTYPNSPCHNPILKLLIHYNGNVALCCEDMREEFDLGNAFEQSLWNLWYSEKHVRIARDLKEGKRHLYSLCSQCPIAPFHVDWGKFD
jgi:radical SAM protein with 4Fe4S-binding SPASM domain